MLSIFEATTMRELLGGEGANLAEMTNIGLPVTEHHNHNRSLQRIAMRTAEQSAPD